MPAIANNKARVLSLSSMPDQPGSLIPPPHRPESFRLLGLLFGMAMLALVARWLQSEDTAPSTNAVSLNAAMSEAVADRPVRLAEARAETRTDISSPPSGIGLDPSAGSRPISAALCHALDEKIKALHGKAAGDLSRREMKALRAERARVHELQTGLRCRPSGGRYWF